MNKIIQKICNDVVELYKPDKNVLGILLFGSVARNKSDQYSDVDIYILLSKPGKFSRSNFVKNGVRVDIILDPIKETKKYLDTDKNNIRRITSHMLAHGEIIFQRGSYLEKIQALAKSNLKQKTKYSKNEVLMHKYSIDDFWGEVQRDLNNKDYVAFGIDSHLLLTNIIELFLKLNGEFLRQPNEIKQVLTNIDSAFSVQVENFYKTTDFQKKQRILTDLVQYIYKKSKGALPNKWFLEG